MVPLSQMCTMVWAYCVIVVLFGLCELNGLKGVPSHPHPHPHHCLILFFDHLVDGVLEDLAVEGVIPLSHTIVWSCPGVLWSLGFSSVQFLDGLGWLGGGGMRSNLSEILFRSFGGHHKQFQHVQGCSLFGHHTSSISDWNWHEVNQHFCVLMTVAPSAANPATQTTVSTTPPSTTTHPITAGKVKRRWRRLTWILIF